MRCTESHGHSRAVALLHLGPTRADQCRTNFGDFEPRGCGIRDKWPGINHRRSVASRCGYSSLRGESPWPESRGGGPSIEGGRTECRLSLYENAHDALDVVAA